jgi:hypothetical protein
MGLQRALEFVGGAVGVYLAMVACSGAVRTPRPEGAAGESVASAGASGESGRASVSGGAPGRSAGGQGGLSDGVGGESVESFAGLITDPTPDAGAQEAGAGPGPETCECPEPPVVPEEITWERYDVDCETVPETNATKFALLDLPDVSELRRIRTVAVVNGASDAHALLGFTGYAPGATLLRPSGVGLACTFGGDYPSVSFYVPSR